MSNARTPTAVWLIIFLCYNNKSQLIQSRDHSSVLAWRIPGAVEPGGLPSMGSHRVRHDWSDLAAAAEMLQRPNGRGIEPGNGAELSWRQTVQLMDPHNKITKGTHTHTHTRPPKSDHLWYLWETLLSFLFLGGTNQSKEKSQEQNLHLVSPVVFLLEQLRVFQRLECMGIGSAFYRIALLAWCVMNQWLSFLTGRLHRSHLQ